MGSESKKTNSELLNEGISRKNKRKIKEANEVNQKIKEETKSLNLLHLFETIELGTIYGGFRVKELSSHTGIQRRNLTKYLDILREEKSIILDRKTGLIRSTSEYFDDVEDNKYLTWKFAHDFLNLFHKKRFFTLSTNNPEILIEDNHQVNPKRSNSKGNTRAKKPSNDEYLEKLIYEFSNRIGCYITYIILINLNPNIITQRISSGMPIALIEQMILHNVNYAVRELVNHSKPSLLHKFIQIINDNYASIPFELNNQKNIIEIKLNKEFYDHVIKSLNNIYPLMVRELAKIYEDYPFINPKQLLDSKRKTLVQLEAHRNRVKKRDLINKCNHEFENILGILQGRYITQSILESESNIDSTKIKKHPQKIQYQVCRMCHFRIPNSELNDSRILRKRKLKS